MARITVEDCIARIPNRFELTLAAAWRARDIAHGHSRKNPDNRDKPPVCALREIGEGHFTAEQLLKKVPV